MIDTGEEIRRYILIAVETGRAPLSADASLDELRSLLETAGGEEAGRMIQPLEAPSARSYFGTGKIEELKELLRQTGADGVIADDELTPAQLRNLGDLLDTQVLDRTTLILEIFAMRAHTREGQLQVELAELRYRLSRLSGFGATMSRQGGGSGVHARGAGETKLELDRRYIRGRIAALRQELEEITAQRDIRRSRRQKNEVPMVALVGYTNAGKSTIFNRLTQAGVLEEDKLFATLDTTTRRLELSNGREIILADTVGFIQKLPHHLVDAFHATLEEVAYADLLVHVVDSSDPKASLNMKITMDAMQSLGAGDKPIITVFNKNDLPQPTETAGPDYLSEAILHICAYEAEGQQALLTAVETALDKQMHPSEMLIPYDKGSIINLLHENGSVIEEEYREDGIYIKVQLSSTDLGRYQAYLLK
ncbi:MAG: GTPase HflX [Clostridiales bacterium]|nr:GTPase HflX [Clostridiales bacterium]